MIYKDFIKNVKVCPFCNPEESVIIEKNELCYLTYSLAPYHKHHMMVVPYRHIKNYEELTAEEIKCGELLLHRGVKIINALGYQDYTILLRNGKNSGKSIDHLHYHIIPATIIGDLNHKGDYRKVMMESEVSELMREFRELETKIGK